MHWAGRWLNGRRIADTTMSDRRKGSAYHPTERSNDSTRIPCAGRGWRSSRHDIDGHHTIAVAVEVAAAVTEALEREEESGEVGLSLLSRSQEEERLMKGTVHRLAATLALVLFKSPNHEALTELLGALGARETLVKKRKFVEREKGKEDAVGVMRDLEKLLS